MDEIKVSTKVLSFTVNEYIVEQIINDKVFIICCFSPRLGKESYVEFNGIRHNFSNNEELLFILEKYSK